MIICVPYHLLPRLLLLLSFQYDSLWWWFGCRYLHSSCCSLGSSWNVLSARKQWIIDQKDSSEMEYHQLTSFRLDGLMVFFIRILRGATKINGSGAAGMLILVSALLANNLAPLVIGRVCLIIAYSRNSKQIPKLRSAANWPRTIENEAITDMSTCTCLTIALI